MADIKHLGQTLKHAMRLFRPTGRLSFARMSLKIHFDAVNAGNQAMRSELLYHCVPLLVQLLEPLDDLLMIICV